MHHLYTLLQAADGEYHSQSEFLFNSLGIANMSTQLHLIAASVLESASNLATTVASPLIAGPVLVAVIVAVAGVAYSSGSASSGKR